MNTILTNKINRHLIYIIQEYNMPSLRGTKRNLFYLEELLNKTISIRFDFKFNNYYLNDKKFKMKRNKKYDWFYANHYISHDPEIFEKN